MSFRERRGLHKCAWKQTKCHSLFSQMLVILRDSDSINSLDSGYIANPIFADLLTMLSI